MYSPAPTTSTPITTTHFTTIPATSLSTAETAPSTPPPKAIQAAFSRLIDDPWQLASAEAHLWSETHGWKPPGVGMLQNFTAKMHAAAAIDNEVYSAFLDVVHLDKRPTSLFRPRLLRKIMRAPAA